MNKYIEEIERSKKYIQITFAFLLIVASLNFHADENSPEIEKEKSEQTSKTKKEYDSIEEFIEDGEYEILEGFMNILHETEKDKYYLILEKINLTKSLSISHTY